MGIKDDGSLDRRHRTAATQAQVTRKVQDLERHRGKTVLTDAGPGGLPPSTSPSTAASARDASNNRG
jgi:hypothetical protein